LRESYLRSQFSPPARGSLCDCDVMRPRIAPTHHLFIARYRTCGGLITHPIAQSDPGLGRWPTVGHGTRERHSNLADARARSGGETSMRRGEEFAERGRRRTPPATSACGVLRGNDARCALCMRRGLSASGPPAVRLRRRCVYSSASAPWGAMGGVPWGGCHEVRYGVTCRPCASRVAPHGIIGGHSVLRRVLWSLSK